jgi:hypothetical protein
MCALSAEQGPDGGVIGSKHLWPTAEDRTRAGAAAMLAAVFGKADEWLTNEPAAQPAELQNAPLRR